MVVMVLDCFFLVFSVADLPRPLDVAAVAPADDPAGVVPVAAAPAAAAVPVRQPDDDNAPSMAKVLKFCEDQEKINTRKATNRDVKHFSDWLLSTKFVLLDLHEIPPEELNELLAQYLVFVRKSDGSEYQPGTLVNMFHSIARYLKGMKYYSSDNRVCLLKDIAFEDARKALRAKMVQLRKQGLGNRPNRSVAVEPEEEDVMWEKGVLGVSSPFSLQFTLWYFLTLLTGLRGCDEHRSMRFGDITMKQDAAAKEFLELRERGSKTRDGSVPRDGRATAQKIFCSCDVNRSRCLVEIFK